MEQSFTKRIKTVEKLFEQAKQLAQDDRPNAELINNIRDLIPGIQGEMQAHSRDFGMFNFTRGELNKVTRAGWISRLYDLIEDLGKKTQAKEKTSTTIDNIRDVVKKLNGFPDRDSELEYIKSGGTPFKLGKRTLGAPNPKPAP